MLKHTLVFGQPVLGFKLHGQWTKPARLRVRDHSIQNTKTQANVAGYN